MSINDNIYDRMIDHLTDVRLYEEGVQVQNKRILARHRKNLKTLLKENLSSNLVPEQKRFRAELTSFMSGTLKEFSTSQLDFHTDNIYKEVRSFYDAKRPRTKELLAEISGSNIKGSTSVIKNIDNISQGELVRMQTKIRGGLAKGLSKDEIISDILKTTKLTENQARTLARTSITSTQTSALRLVAEQNKEIFDGFVFTAILDSRTSPICSFHNGKVYGINDKRFVPPLHWNCRSSLVPVLKSKEKLLEVKSDKIKKNKLKDLAEEKLTGNTPKRESFGAWLKRQAFDTQTKILGSMDKANLFREGKLKYDQFITPAGKALSIQALRARASRATALFTPRQKLREADVDVKVAKPSSLVRNPKAREDLRQLFLLDSDDYSKTLSLTDFKGTSLAGKTASRRRVGNEFDERNFSVDPLTGEVKNNNIYDPDFNLYQERLDFMRGSKLLKQDEKDFIENFTSSLEDKVSLNQQTVIVENLRVVFERYAKDKQPWLDFSAVVRAENRFSVQNVSRLLDTRARKRSEMFVSYLSADKPKVQIMGEYYDFDKLQKQQLTDQRFIDNWRANKGKSLATKFYFLGRSPKKLYYRNIFNKLITKEQVIKRLKNTNPTLYKAHQAISKQLKEMKKPKDFVVDRWIANLRENYRYIVDMEWFYAKQKPTSKFFDDKVLDELTKAFKLVASGQATDYDSLAINIGKSFNKEFEKFVPGVKHTLADYHKEGVKVLEFMKEQGLIRIQFRGKTRRGVMDLDTGRASGGWADTISREVIVLDKDLLQLQAAERRVTISRRLGITEPRDRLYVKAGKKTYVDARGNDTGLPIISRDKFPDYDENQIDKDIARTLNHVMDVEYRVDDEFFSFMDDLVRFRDPRGNREYFDNLNEFRHEILNRGEQGYGLMATAKYHNQRKQAFRTLAFIDSRGRVYHRGYLTPTGGELVRPFLNSGRAVNMTEAAMDELKIQLGALIGPGTEALTQAGRRSIFNRNEALIREVGELMLAKTQRDRRIKQFLEHPLLQGLEGAEVAKLGRMAVEYARIYRFTNGDISDIGRLRKYKTSLMIENDASSSGAQIIGLSTGDRAISQASNVLATNQKNRLYDLVAMDTVNDPEFLKIPALRDANLTWEDLAKAAKAQNMVSFYGAGAATKTANVANKFAKVLEEKGFITITKDTLGNQLRVIDGKIKVADRMNSTTVSRELKAFRAELIELINKNEPAGRTLLKQAMEIHPDVGDFVEKLTNARRGIVGPKEFAEISRIMSNNLAQRAPVTDNFITYWKRVAKAYVNETQKVDIPWVTFDGKVMMQRYRPKIQERIDFEDPITGRKISNIYESSVEDGKLLGKSSLNDASIGLGVNGNHSNDAVIVRRFHLWGRKNNVQTATIHDAFFTNISEADKAKDALRTIYADALGGDTIRKTLKQMRKEGMSRKTYKDLLAEAKSLGLIDPVDKITRKDILAPFKDGEDWYGIGP